MFASVDLTSLLSGLSGLVDTLSNADGWVAGLGAVSLLVMQLVNKKVGVVAGVKTLLAKFAPKRIDVLGIPDDLSDAELAALKDVVDKLKALRAGDVADQAVKDQAVVDDQKNGLLARILDAFKK